MKLPIDLVLIVLREIDLYNIFIFDVHINSNTVLITYVEDINILSTDTNFTTSSQNCQKCTTIIKTGSKNGKRK